MSWFAPAPPERLALLRILVGLWSLHYIGRRASMFERIARTDASLCRPVGPAAVLRKPVSPRGFRVLLRASQLANLAFVFGWRHRATGPLYGTSLLWLLSYRNSWSMVFHNDNALVLHALVLGVSPAADALSVDSLAAKHRGGAPHARYVWPIKLINTITIATYFLAGVAKLKGPLGRRWATGESLRSQVAADGLRKELLGEHAAPLALRLYDQLAVYRLLALGSLVIEMGAPAALVDRRLARLWALGAFGMHWGIFPIMKIRFRYQMAGLIFAPFSELERLLPRELGGGSKC